MSNRYRRVQMICLIAVGLIAITGMGCTLARSLMVQTAPTTEKVEAEYADLSEHKTLVYVWAKPETLWDYPQLRIDLSAHLNAYLKEHLKPFESIDPPQVEKYIKSQTSMNPDPVQVGRNFHVDRVIHVSLYKFSMRDPGMSQFYRGRISASIVVLDLSAKDGTVQRTPLKDVVTVVPEEGPLGLTNVTAEQIRDMTYREFTQTTGRKFHEWEKDVK